MNMISTAFPIEADASSRQETLVKKLVTAWEKKNSKAAKASGASLMALSLAACGAEDETPFAQSDIDTAVATAVAAVDITTDNVTASAAAVATAIAGVDITTDNATASAAAVATAIAGVDITTDNASASAAAVAAAVAAVDITSDNAAATLLTLRDSAATMGVTGTSSMTQAELITAIKTANDVAIAAAVDLTTDNASATNASVLALGYSGVTTLAQLDTVYAAAIAPAAASLNGTASVDTLTGTASADVFKFDNTGINQTSTADTVDGAGGSDTLEIYSDGTLGTALPQVTSVETIHLYDESANFSLSASPQASLTKLMMTRGDGVLTATLPATIDTVELTDIAGTGTTVFALTATDAAINLNTNSITYATGEDINFTGAGLRTVVLTNTGTSTIGTLDIVAGTSLTIDAAGKTTFIDDIETTGTLGTMTITGAGAVDVSALDVGFTTVNAGGNSGGFTAEIGTNDDTVLTGSTGNDSITASSTDALAAADLLAVNAGNGTDTLTILATADVNTAADAARYTNFETLSLVDSQDMSLVGGITALTIGASTSETFSKLTTTQAANITMSANNTTSQIFSFASNTTADAITLNLNSTTATTNVDAVGMDVDLIETVNVNATTGTNATGDTAFGFLANKSDAVTAVNFTGTADMTFNVVANTLDVVAVAIDASALTGTSDFTLTLNGGLVTGSSVVATDRADSITISSVVGTTHDGKAGNDAFTGSVADLVATGANDNTVDGGAGTDKITLDDTTTTITDNHFTKISNMETLNLSNTTGDASITLGGSFNTAFATGMKMATGTMAAAKDVVFSGGLATVGVNLTVDATSKVMANSEDDVITTGSGDDTITFTGDASTVGHASASGSLIISTGAGADTITVTVGTIITAAEQFIEITAGAGKDTITMTKINMNDVSGSALITIAAGDSTTTAYDEITGFDIGAASLFSDGIEFAGTAIAGTLATQNDFGVILSSSITDGKADFDDASGFSAAIVVNDGNLADVLGYLNSNGNTNGVIAFDFDSTGNGTDDATMLYHNGSSDSLVLLAGITTADSIVATAAAAAGDIFVG